MLRRKFACLDVISYVALHSQDKYFYWHIIRVPTVLNCVSNSLMPVAIYMYIYIIKQVIDLDRIVQAQY